MSKGAPEYGVSTPRKRAKPSHTTQLRLDNFFTSPSSKLGSISGGYSDLRAKPSSITSEPIDVDALELGPAQPPLEPGSSPKRTKIAATGATTATPVVAAFGGGLTQPEQLEYKALCVDPVFYNPHDQPWTSQNIPYSFLAHSFTTLAQTRSRIAIINTLTNTLRTIVVRHSPSLLPALYLLSNALSPPYVAIELGLGSSVISKAIQQSSGLSYAALKHLYNTTGDIGDVAFLAKSKIRTLVPHPPLTVGQVYESLLRIAGCKGQGASKQKERIVEILLVAGNGDEIRYIVRTLSQNLRVGAVRTSILTALARAVVFHPPPDSDFGDVEVCSLYASAELLSRVQPLPANAKNRGSEDPAREELKSIFTRAEALVKTVYIRHPCYDDIVSALLESGLSKLGDRVPLAVGIPLHPTLGTPVRSLTEVYERLGDIAFSAEYKYDGQRAQIHASVDASGKISVRIFSRHLEDMTSKYPDVIALMQNIFIRPPSPESFVIDSEVVAVDPKTGCLRSFQELSNRSRKDVQLTDIRVPVCVFAFDLLYYNHESFISRPFRERRALLRERFAPYIPEDDSSARFRLVESCESCNGKTALAEFWERAVESRCEGLMIKVLDNIPSDDKELWKSGRPRKQMLTASYEPDKRIWLKLKKDYVEGIGDSLDLVPIGAWYGNGRKAGWWSPVLLGLWNAERGRAVAVCKCMSGFTDVFYRALSEKYKLDSAVCSSQSRWECDFGGFRPDVYFKPQEVWEIKGADITESPVSVAARGLVSSSRGLSLRFPRFIKIRTDKGIEQASTPQYLANMCRQQQGKPVATGVDDDDLVDVDFEEDSGSEDVEDDSDPNDGG